MFSLSNDLFLFHACAICSELPSNISSMPLTTADAKVIYRADIIHIFMSTVPMVLILDGKSEIGAHLYIIYTGGTVYYRKSVLHLHK